MLIVIYGDDFKKTRERLNDLVKDFADKKPDISLVKIDEDNISNYDISEFLLGQGLFEKEILIVFDHILALEPLNLQLENILPKMAQSKNTFIFLEGSLNREIVAIAKKETSQIEEFRLKKTPQKIFNPFSLGDALGEKNRRKLWTSFYKALRYGMTAEEIHGILFWQIKSILIAKSAPNLKDSGLKPFVYGKGKQFALKFKTEELKKKSNELVDLYHQSRKGVSELPIALEKFILRI